MEHATLILVNFIVYFLLAIKMFTFYKGIMAGKQYSVLFQMMVGAINAAILCIDALYIPIYVAYAISFVILFAELCIFFRRPIMEILTVTVATMMGVMCFRGINISIFALIKHSTISEVISNPNNYLSALAITNIFQWLAITAALHNLDIRGIHTTLSKKKHIRYILIWAVVCTVFIFKSLELYGIDNLARYVIIEHMNFCFVVLLSSSYLLSYTFKLSATSEEHKTLSKALGSQMSFQSALMRDAIFVAHANLTTNKILSGLEVYGETLDFLKSEYDAWFEFSKHIVHPQDFNVDFKYLDRQCLLKNFELGIEPKPFEYRRLGRDNEYYWVRSVVRMFNDVETGDVHVFGYAFDIDGEVRERQALERSAHMDLFTGLYNKLTTEAFIEDEIRKGTGILVSLDVDDFKDVNDHYGHEAGDCVLKYVANLLLDTFRKCDIVGRIGGDEFMAFIKDTADISLAEDRANRILTSLQGTPIRYANERIKITVSIGISVIGRNIDSFSEAYKQVDSALYQAKQGGKNNYVVYDHSLESSVG